MEKLFPINPDDLQAHLIQLWRPLNWNEKKKKMKVEWFLSIHLMRKYFRWKQSCLFSIHKPWIKQRWTNESFFLKAWKKPIKFSNNCYADQWIWNLISSLGCMSNNKNNNKIKMLYNFCVYIMGWIARNIFNVYIEIINNHWIE